MPEMKNPDDTDARLRRGIFCKYLTSAGVAAAAAAAAPAAAAGHKATHTRTHVYMCMSEHVIGGGSGGGGGVHLDTCACLSYLVWPRTRFPVFGAPAGGARGTVVY